MATRMIAIHDYCTAEGCGQLLHSIVEGVRGTCEKCYYKTMPKGTKKTLARLLEQAFSGPTGFREKWGV